MGYRKGQYVRLSDRVAESGDYELIDPFDYLILGLLPDDGTTLGGYYPIGVSVGELRTKHFTELSADKIAARLRTMREQRLTKPLMVGKARNSDLGWQRTTTGKEVYEAWKQQQK